MEIEMRFFVFIVMIPMIAVIMSSYFGVGWFDNVGIAAAINLPVCIVSALIYNITGD